MARLLVIEKKEYISALLKRRFSKDRIAIDSVGVIDAAPEKFRQGVYDVLILDGDLSKSDRPRAVELLETLSTNFPQTQIIASALEKGGSSSDGIKGVYPWLKRASDERELCVLVDMALQKKAVVDKAKAQRLDVLIPVEFEGIIAVSLPMRSVIQQILEAAAVDIPVLITGETGTGKELVAQAIHQRSKRKDCPYIQVNTGAMAPELIHSELFGHVKGAYTGAFEAHQGLFEQADKGAIFLDEITTMDEKTQVSLLRVLETKTFRRLQGERDIRVDVRVIAATNENLEEAVRERRFREDLYYRLDVFRINLPPLRSRPGAVTVLTDHFVSCFDIMYHKNVRVVSPETYRRLRRYPWPGNVRELKNVIQRAVVMAPGEELTPDCLPSRIRETAESKAQADVVVSPFCVGMTLETVEREFIAMTLASTGGNKTKAASILGISRRALYDKLKKQGSVYSAKIKNSLPT